MNNILPKYVVAAVILITLLFTEYWLLKQRRLMKLSAELTTNGTARLVPISDEKASPPPGVKFGEEATIIRKTDGKVFDGTIEQAQAADFGSVVAAPEPIRGLVPETKPNGIFFAGPTQGGEIRLSSDPSTSHQVVISFAGAPVLSIAGLPHGERAKNPAYLVPLYRPAEADEAEVYVYTKDGRRWRAVWVEDPEERR